MDTPNPDRVGSTRTFTIPETYVGVLFDALDDAQDYRQQGDCSDCEAAPNGQCEDHARDANRAQAYDRLVQLLSDVTPPKPPAVAPLEIARFDPSQYSWVPFDESLLSDKDKEEPQTITVDLTIENTYERYPDETTYRKGLVIPVPPAKEDDAYEDWKYDHIHSETGVGHEDGDSWYDVTVTASSRPDVLPVGTTFDFGY